MFSRTFPDPPCPGWVLGSRGGLTQPSPRGAPRLGHREPDAPSGPVPVGFLVGPRADKGLVKGGKVC